MTRRARTVGGIAMLAVTAAFLYAISDLRRLPFHPDESTWIFMSHDFDTALSDFGRLRWRRGMDQTGIVRLRLLNAPMPKYVIGVGRWLGGYRNVPSLAWDWTESWEQDVAEGALPDGRLLQAARLSATAMYALSVGVFFVLAADVAGLLAASVATMLLVFHPLEQIHLRRAMAESTLQLFSIAAVLAAVRWVGAARTSPRSGLAGMVAGIVFGLAVASKQSAASLALVVLACIVAAGWAAGTHGTRLRKISGLAAMVAAAAILIFVAVNPVLYDQPIRAAYTMVTARQTLAADQVKDAQTISPSLVLPGVLTRLAASYREVFWNPPAFSEFAAYDDMIAPEVKLYAERWATRAAASRYLRVALILLTLLGTIGAVFTLVKDRFGARTRPLQIVLVWVIADVVFIAAFVPLDWQRYFVPLVPPACILAGYGYGVFTSYVVSAFRRTS